jgi:hypothetical protein
MRIALLIVLLAQPVLACSMQSYDANDLVENEPEWSANGRFAVVVRWFEGIPDFKSERAGKVFGFDNPAGDEQEHTLRWQEILRTMPR